MTMAILFAEKCIHPSIHHLQPRILFRVAGGWSQSQLTLGELQIYLNFT